jgi:hypothetical protein
MRVHVDKTRRDDLIFGVDYFRGIGWIDSAEACDAAILNSYVRPKPWIASAIHNTSVSDYQIV